jgi:hypothetical protein
MVQDDLDKYWQDNWIKSQISTQTNSCHSHNKKNSKHSQVLKYISLSYSGSQIRQCHRNLKFGKYPKILKPDQFMSYPKILKPD